MIFAIVRIIVFYFSGCGNASFESRKQLPTWPREWHQGNFYLNIFMICQSNWERFLEIAACVFCKLQTPIGGHKRVYSGLIPSPEPSPEGGYVGQHSQGLGGHYADSYLKRKRIFWPQGSASCCIPSHFNSQAMMSSAELLQSLILAWQSIDLSPVHSR